MIPCDFFNIDWIKPEDAKGLALLMNRNATIFKPYFPLTLSANRNEEDSAIFIKSISEDIKTQKQFLFTLKTEGKLIGLVYLKELEWDKKEGEFAYCMDPDYGGRGWMSQAVKAITTYAFSNYKLDVLKIIVHHTNIPSVKVAQHNGFQFIETLKNEYTPPNGTPLDMDLYVLKK